MRGHKPIHPEAFEYLKAYLEQAEHEALARYGAPEPNPLLLISHMAPPFSLLAAGPPPVELSEPLGAYFRFANLERNPRWLPPLDFLCLRLLLAFGGSAGVNADGRKSWGTVVLFGQNIKLGRILANAPPGAEVCYESPRGELIDHHCYHREYLHVVPVGTGKTEGKPTRGASYGRPDAIREALRLKRLNGVESGISITDEEYLNLLNRAFALADAAYGEEPSTREPREGKVALVK